MNSFFKKLYQEFCHQVLNRSKSLNASLVNGQIDEAKHQIELAQKKLERGLRNGY
jgi:hypothetical protein